MKNYIMFLGLALLFVQCKKEEVGPFVQLNSAPTITAPTAGTSFVMSEPNMNEILTIFTWTMADFGFQAGITYELQIDAVGNNFEQAIGLGSVDGLTIEDLTQGKLNNILLARGLPFGVENDLEIRVCASVSERVEKLCSEPINLKVVPYKADVEYPLLNVPGDYQDWVPENNETAIFSRQSDEKYEGYIYFGKANALYKYAKGSWDENWGDDENDGVLNPGGFGNDIPLENEVGMFLMKADLNTLEHSAIRTDWGVLGSATLSGNTDDLDLAWEDERSVLSITTDLTAGSLRFRANDADEIVFGDDFGNSTLEQNGEDIIIAEAGSYTIDLVLTVGDYTYTVTKN